MPACQGTHIQRETHGFMDFELTYIIATLTHVLATCANFHNYLAVSVDSGGVLLLRAT